MLSTSARGHTWKNIILVKQDVHLAHAQELVYLELQITYYTSAQTPNMKSEWNEGLSTALMSYHESHGMPWQSVVNSIKLLALNLGTGERLPLLKPWMDEFQSRVEFRSPRLSRKVNNSWQSTNVDHPGWPGKRPALTAHMPALTAHIPALTAHMPARLLKLGLGEVTVAWLSSALVCAPVTG